MVIVLFNDWQFFWQLILLATSTGYSSSKVTFKLEAFSHYLNHLLNLLSE